MSKKIDKIYKLLDEKLEIRYKYEKTNPDYMNSEIDRIEKEIDKLNEFLDRVFK